MGEKLTCRAVWTRFHPIAYAVQDVIFSGKLGKVKRFQADFSMFFDIESECSPLCKFRTNTARIIQSIGTKDVHAYTQTSPTATA